MLKTLLEHSLNYSGKTDSLWFYSKDGAFDFNVDITDTNAFISFKHKAKSVGNNETDRRNKTLKDATTIVH